MNETDRTNEPGTCLWCGKKVKKEKLYDYGKNLSKTYTGEKRWVVDQWFHSQRCAWRFAQVAAKGGIRLNKMTNAGSLDK